VNRHGIADRDEPTGSGIDPKHRQIAALHVRGEQQRSVRSDRKILRARAPARHDVDRFQQPVDPDPEYRDAVVAAVGAVEKPAVGRDPESYTLTLLANSLIA
jgi:hypothetical protein